MKDYITSVVENTEIKDLMEKLIYYKNDIYDKSYVKLKVSDNIDRYRLDIITALEHMQEDETIVKAISKNYAAYTKTEDDAINRSIRLIDEVIDAFNAIEDFITEIDNKNRNYINSTIGKIKFLLTEDDNIIGKLNGILKYIRDTNKEGNVDKAMRLVDSLYTIPQMKIMNGEYSLYQPRGSYQRNYNQTLDDIGLTGFEMTDDFLSQFKNSYNEDEIKAYLEAHLKDSVFKASDVLYYDCTNEEFLMTVYCIIYAAERQYVVSILDNIIDTKRFTIKDFEIKKTLF
jgi:hypothetical protein